MDRIVDLQIDDGDRAVHVIVELYDRGNIVLTDSSYIILNILRPRTDKDNDVRLVVRERYPLPASRSIPQLPSVDEMAKVLRECDPKITLKRAVAQPGLFSGPLIEHALLAEGLNPDFQVHVRADTAKVRKEMWFEKFIWFISSENYIVVVGRDAQQNELLVKRYLRPGDIYVHADAHGAASLVIRNKAGGGAIPPKTMTEAAQMAICCSSSWSSHVISSAWWVYDHQVSKVAPSGEYLSHGSFMIRGKKNFMPGSPLVLGFGILFRLDEASVTNRKQNLSHVDDSSKNSFADVEEKVEMEEVLVEEESVEVDKADEDYPDIQLDVPTVNYHSEHAAPEDYTVVEFSTKSRPKKQVPVKEKETLEYLEKKKEEERKANAAKKGGKRQKHKMDKIRKKYRDQDEEEREMRLTVLGSRGKQEKADSQTAAGKKQDDAKTKKGGTDEERVIDGREVEKCNDHAPHNEENGEEVCVQQPSKGDEQQDNELGQIATLQIRDRQDAGESSAVDLHGDHLNKDVTGEDDEGKEEILASEDSEGVIAQLTSNPTSEDVLLYAVPMVGPYQVSYLPYPLPGASRNIPGPCPVTACCLPKLEALPVAANHEALSSFKYKVKITPGTARKGKAGKAALDLFLRMKKGDPREQALIRALVGDENACRNIPKGCRVSAPQLYAK
ncbi:hypothetical protein TELCIR_08035 [Teladorsagia circumcincta]|uniref:NFACT RNA-binding domain-containing protein n=1 Tax=Teladorsagia circumcincta TaxID=45464 RepID=A0A2G9UKV8_TELCI|nr:hypothetical protein TELCIR_08035 [Teladorsagia circumcincta]